MPISYACCRAREPRLSTGLIAEVKSLPRGDKRLLIALWAGGCKSVLSDKLFHEMHRDLGDIPEQALAYNALETSLFKLRRRLAGTGIRIPSRGYGQGHRPVIAWRIYGDEVTGPVPLIHDGRGYHADYVLNSNGSVTSDFQRFGSFEIWLDAKREEFLKALSWQLVFPTKPMIEARFPRVGPDGRRTCGGNACCPKFERFRGLKLVLGKSCGRESDFTDGATVMYKDHDERTGEIFDFEPIDGDDI